MSTQPIHPPPFEFDRTADNELAVTAMLDRLDLPAPTLTPRPDAVHVTVTSASDLAQWVYALGGQVRRTCGGGDVVVWTLHTRTPERRGGPVPIRVHAAVVDGVDVFAELRVGVPS